MSRFESEPPAGKIVDTSYTIPNPRVHMAASYLLNKILKIKVSGTENIPPTGALVSPNHVSGWDILVIGAGLKQNGYRGTFLAKEELFEKFLVRQAVQLCGTIPINRDKPSRESVRAVHHVLASAHDPYLVTFFQGTRMPGAPTEIKDGGYAFSRSSGRPIVPTGIAYPADFGLRNIREPIYIHFGQPLEVPKRNQTDKQVFLQDMLVGMQTAYDQAQALRWSESGV